MTSHETDTQFAGAPASWRRLPGRAAVVAGGRLMAVAGEVVRAVRRDDRHAWLAMRSALWPDSHEDHADEIAAYLAGESEHMDQVYVVDRGGRAAAFIELRLRNYAEGSACDRVPYVEGWYVEPELRGRGLGRALMARAERWATDGGYRELASDAEIDNGASIRAHRALGFEETERVVCFLKRLDG